MKLQWEPTIHTTIMITLEPHPGRATPCKNLGTQTGRYCSWPRIFLRPFWPWLICKCDYPPVLPNYSNWWFEIGFCQKYPYLHLWWNTRSCVKRHHTLTLIGCFWCHFVADTFWTNERLNYVSYRPIQVPIRLSDELTCIQESGVHWAYENGTVWVYMWHCRFSKCPLLVPHLPAHSSCEFPNKPILRANDVSSSCIVCV